MTGPDLPPWPPPNPVERLYDLRVMLGYLLGLPELVTVQQTDGQLLEMAADAIRGERR